jgi:heptosyltransferase II
MSALRAANEAQRRERDFTSIAVFLPNWIGDVVMATPAIRGLWQQFPQATFTAVCKPYVSATLAGAPWFRHTVHFDKRGAKGVRFLGALQELRKLKPDLALLFPNSFTPALLARLAGAKEVVGFARYGRDFLLSKRLYCLRGVDGKPRPHPAMLDYNRLAMAVGTPDPGHRMELFTTPADDEQAEQFFQKQGWTRGTTVIGLNSGGAFGSSKHWPNAHFAELARMCARRGWAVAMLCGPSERATALDILKQADHANVRSVAEENLSIGFTKSMVRRLIGFVTTDSGPRHFAAAFGIPVVTLFGPTHQEWTTTNFDLEEAIQKSVPCGPCQLRVCPLDHRCMTTLTPAEVFERLERVLHRQERRRAG